jgi:acetyl esterase/lipase
MIRLLLPLVLALASLLTIFKAPSNFFWRVQVALTEFPYFSIAASLILFVTCFWLGKYRTAAVCVTGISLVLFCMPLVRAYDRSNKMGDELKTAFNVNPETGFSFWKMFGSSPTIVPQQLEYKTIKGQALTLDFYAAPNSTAALTVVVIHGGSWSSGDNTQFVEWNSWMASQGYNVAAINYRLAPVYKSPSQVEDVRDAIQFLKIHNLNIDTNKFVLLGRSAGGQIALCAAYQLAMKEIVGVITIYSPADMVWGAKIKGNPLVLNTDDVFADYLGGPYDQFADKYLEASAVQHVKASSPPTLIIHGDNDCMVSFMHSQHLDSALTENKVPHYFLNLPGATHACDYNLNGPSGQLMQTAIKLFVLSLK